MDCHITRGDGFVFFEAMFERAFTDNKVQFSLEYEHAYQSIEIGMREDDPEQGFNVCVPTTKQELLELRNFIDKFIQQLP